jgi:cyclase
MTGRYRVYSASRGREHKEDPAAFAKKAEALGAGEVLLNSVDMDGTQKGYDTELIRGVAGAVGVPVIACGGAGKLSDFSEAVRSGAAAVAAGSLFVFQGKYRAVLISYPKAEDIEALFAGGT